MPSLSERIALHESTDHSAGGIPTKDAYTLWREWYAMEDIRPAGTVGDPAYDSWTAECARIYTAARDTEARATLRIDPATRMSDAPCPYDATTDSECSVLRDATRSECPAHGPWLPPMD